MALKSYVLKQDMKVPYVTNTGHAARPTQVRFKRFKKGDIISGELKHANNKPVLVMVKGVLPVPVWAVKELISKEIVTGADGKETLKDATITAPPSNVDKFPKVKVADAVIVGAIIGIIGVYLAEKKGIIKEPDKKNKIYGAAGGAALFGYIAFRMKNKRIKTKPKS
jgi:hypothetical protein